MKPEIDPRIGVIRSDRTLGEITGIDATTGQPTTRGLPNHGREQPIYFDLPWVRESLTRKEELEKKPKHINVRLERAEAHPRRWRGRVLPGEQGKVIQDLLEKRRKAEQEDV